MNIKRREFLWFSGSALAVSSLPSFAAEGGAARLTLGVLSDIHLEGRPGDDKWFLKALRHFAEAGVDGVVIAGDIANYGRVTELRQCADAWNAVFPGDKGPDGRHVEKLFVYGNHECIRDKKKYPDEPAWISEGYAKSWRECFGEEWAPVMVKEVKGYTFVLAHYPVGRKSAASMLAKVAPGLDRDKPFFFVQHEHPKDTCYGPWAWGHDNGATTKVLSAYPNAIALSGHSHYPLTDERGIWQDGFTSIGTSTLHHIAQDYSLIDNAYRGGNNFGYQGLESRTNLTPCVCGGKDGKQAMVLRVYDDHVRIERRELAYDLPLGEDWVFPIAKGAAPVDRPYAFDRVRAKRVAPQFGEGAKVTVAQCRSKRKMENPDGLRVTIPAARAVSGCRPWKYEVQVELVEDDSEIVIATRQVLSAHYYLPEEKDQTPSSVIFPLADFPPKAHVRFLVRPVECFGKKGAPIASDIVSVDELAQAEPAK